MADKITKPQSPIMNGDEGVYPLTTYDQIIMPNGSRWNGIVVEDGALDPNSIPIVDMTGTETEQEVPINAQTIDGLTYKQIIELEHGIGSVYFTLNAADDPNNKWNWMTWELVTDKFLLGAGNLYEGGTEGGEAEVTLTDPAQNAPHAHDVFPYIQTGGSSYGLNQELLIANASGTILTTSDSGAIYMGRARTSGGGAAHNNMPPYLSIFMWTRVS